MNALVGFSWEHLNSELDPKIRGPDGVEGPGGYRYIVGSSICICEHSLGTVAVLTLNVFHRKKISRK